MNSLQIFVLLCVAVHALPIAKEPQSLDAKPFDKTESEFLEDKEEVTNPWGLLPDGSPRPAPTDIDSCTDRLASSGEETAKLAAEVCLLQGCLGSIKGKKFLCSYHCEVVIQLDNKKTVVFELKGSRNPKYSFTKEEIAALKQTPEGMRQIKAIGHASDYAYNRAVCMDPMTRTELLTDENAVAWGRGRGVRGDILFRSVREVKAGIKLSDILATSASWIHAHRFYSNSANCQSYSKHLYKWMTGKFWGVRKNNVQAFLAGIGGSLRGLSDATITAVTEREERERQQYLDTLAEEDKDEDLTTVVAPGLPQGGELVDVEGLEIEMDRDKEMAEIEETE